MKLVLFGFVLLFNLLPVCYAIDEYESIFFYKDLFSHEVNTTLYVSLNSKIRFICPNSYVAVRKSIKSRQSSNLFENIWLVENKTSYDNCRVDKKYDPKAELFLCNKPHSLTYLTLLFLEKYFDSTGVFEGGKDYYLISTSNGLES